MNKTKIIHNLLFHESFNDFKSLSNYLQDIKESKVIDSNSLKLVDLKFLEEVKNISLNGEIIYFGKTLKDLKYVCYQENFSKPFEVSIKYQDNEKLIVSEVSLPHTNFQDQEYSSLQELVDSFKSLIANLSIYLQELENIDKYCTVVEPKNPTFKDDYRRILLDHRTWLHVEVNQAGLATNIHLLGQKDVWQDKLQEGLLNWDLDKDIVENILTIFDLVNFPAVPNSSARIVDEDSSTQNANTVPVCNICMCDSLPDDPSLPQPLCNNIVCGVHYHRNCLFQWLVACAGGRPPTFGVATGSCPTCLEPVTCNEADN